VFRQEADTGVFPIQTEDLLALKDAVPIEESCPLEEEEDFA